MTTSENKQNEQTQLYNGAADDSDPAVKERKNNMKTAKTTIEAYVVRGYGPDTLTDTPNNIPIPCWAEYTTLYLPEGWEHVGGNTLMTPSGEIYNLRDAVQVNINQWVAEVGGKRFEINAEPFALNIEAADDGECSDEEYKFIKSFVHKGPKDPLDADLGRLDEALWFLQGWSEIDVHKIMPRHMTAAKFARVWNEIQAESQSPDA